MYIVGDKTHQTYPYQTQCHFTPRSFRELHAVRCTVVLYKTDEEPLSEHGDSLPERHIGLDYNFNHLIYNQQHYYR